jgi:gliding motility-associated lipoprotein GldB
MVRVLRKFCGFLLLLAFMACDFQEKKARCVEQPDISEIDIDLEYITLEDEFLQIDSLEELQAFLNKHPVIAEYFLKRNEFPDEATFQQQLLSKIQNPHIDTLAMEVERVFGLGTDLQQEFEDAFRHLTYYYPDVKIPKIKTIATGFDHDMYVSDSLVIVGLDYYLGEGAKYRPLNVYDYMLRRYNPEYVVPSVMLIYGISPRFNATDVSDKTMLADMISYGKAFYFAKHMMPCTPDSVMIWYTSEEIQGSEDHSDIIWAHFIENEILFESSHEMKRKYIEERPKTYELGNAAPGRIGTWLGWQIVRAYMDRYPEVSLQELMENPDAREIFKKSKYRPE